MLRVTVDVNGRGISQVAAVKTTPSKSGKNKYEIYDVQTVKKGESVVENGEFLGDVTHRYEDGAATLIQKMMDELETLPD